MGMSISGPGLAGVAGANGSASPAPTPKGVTEPPAKTDTPPVVTPNTPLPTTTTTATTDAVAGAAGGGSKGGPTDAVGGAAGLSGMNDILKALQDLLVKLTEMLKALAVSSQPKPPAHGGCGDSPVAQSTQAALLAGAAGSSSSTSTSQAQTNGGGASAAPAAPATSAGTPSRDQLLRSINIPDGQQIATSDARATEKMNDIWATFRAPLDVDVNHLAGM